MNPRLALGLSAAVLAVSLLALVGDLAIYFAHMRVTRQLKSALDVIAFVWPLALVFFGTYLRKVRGGAPIKAKS
ncbi:MAG TPA: hypothetical protein VHY32_01605 [Caulobacteraceae bacterium]|jgi:hypothetical protein|nr:hypothetical protein [Caulobacteraceae bacterium]